MAGRLSFFNLTAILSWGLRLLGRQLCWFFCSGKKKKQQQKRHKEGDNVLISASANGYLFTAVFRQLAFLFF